MNNNRSYGTYNVPKKKPPVKVVSRRFNFRKTFAAMCAMLVIISLMTVYTNQRVNAHTAAVAELARRDSAVEKFNARLVELSASSPLVNFSISVSDSKYSLLSSYNSKAVSDAASTAKLLSASLLLKKVEMGRYDLNRNLDGQKAASSLREMIQQSDDQAWASINSVLTHKALQDYADTLQLSSYSADSNSMSSADMNKLIKLLYEGALLDAPHTKLLLSYMQHTNYEDFISPAVSSSYKLYHKVGINDDEVNDTAIIASDQDSLFITIFSNGNGSYNWPERATTFQAVTKAAIAAYLD